MSAEPKKAERKRVRIEHRIMTRVVSATKWSGRTVPAEINHRLASTFVALETEEPRAERCERIHPS